MQKRGWLRIVEASLAILIVLSSLFFLYTKNVVNTTSNLDSRARAILDEEAAKPYFREAVFHNDISAVNSSISSHVLEGNLAFEVRICSLQDACGKSSYVPVDVYSAERVISSSINEVPPEGLNPKKVRLFLWRIA